MSSVTRFHSYSTFFITLVNLETQVSPDSDIIPVIDPAGLDSLLFVAIVYENRNLIQRSTINSVVSELLFYLRQGSTLSFFSIQPIVQHN